MSKNIFKKILKKSGLSQAEIMLALVMVFLILIYVIMPMLNNFTHTNLKQKWLNVFVKVNTASRTITAKNRGSFEYLFENEQDVINEFEKYLLPTKKCKDSQNEGCWSKWLWDYNKKPGLEFAQGAFMVSEITSSSCEDSSNTFKTCGFLILDVNGNEGPNKIGMDILKIHILKDQIKPAGIEGDILNPSYNCEFGKKYDWGCSAQYLFKI